MSKTTSLPYIGRFAPSPTGLLHFGSLLAALASFLDARSNNGQWLIRIEDIDPPREYLNSTHQILKSLEQHNLTWDQSVLYQSNHSNNYISALESLSNKGLTFPCSCSRKTLKNTEGIHHFPCNTSLNTEFAIRFLCSANTQMSWIDSIQGNQHYSLYSQTGDFILKRKERLWSYHLAATCDDAFQGITNVIRGIDLINTTPAQLALQQALNFSTPQYGHIPIAINDKQKLSKQNHAMPLNQVHPNKNLWNALLNLNQNPPFQLQHESPHIILQWAIEHWYITQLTNQKTTQVPFNYIIDFK
jgi:glutamyl-Q tRNA(Asp) synthetase